MPRSRARPKQKSTRTSVKVKPSVLKARAPSFFQNSSQTYDTKQTQFQNYTRLELLADANQIGAERTSVRGFKPRVKAPLVQRAQPDEPHALELEVPPAEVTVKPVPMGERKLLVSLVSKHGDDYEAMARDMRLNTHQHTASHLKRRLEKMRDHDVMIGGGSDEKRLKVGKKETKNPNPAFGKRSKNFN